MINNFASAVPENTFSAIERLIDSDTFPHSVLLTGDDGNKLLELAFFISSALVCEGANKPCSSCPACLKAEKRIHPDIRVVSPQEKRKSVNMEECREMIMDSFVLPNEANRKIYIITAAHLLDEKVQNALLKSLEEPPEYVYYFLLCQNPSAMLGTVMSRVTVFNAGFGEESALSDEEANEIALSIIKALFLINETALLRATVPLDKDRKLCKKVMECFKFYLNAALRAKNGIGKDETGMSSRFTAGELLALNECADAIISGVERNANEKLLITLMSASFRHAIGG